MLMTGALSRSKIRQLRSEILQCSVEVPWHEIKFVINSNWKLYLSVWLSIWALNHNALRGDLAGFVATSGSGCYNIYKHVLAHQSLFMEKGGCTFVRKKMFFGCVCKQIFCSWAVRKKVFVFSFAVTFVTTFIFQQKHSPSPCSPLTQDWVVHLMVHPNWDTLDLRSSVSDYQVLS